MTTDLKYSQKMASPSKKSPTKTCASTFLNQGTAFGRPGPDSTNPHHLACGARFCPTESYAGVWDHDRLQTRQYYLVASAKEFVVYTNA
jgi:hypothetical protein